MTFLSFKVKNKEIFGIYGKNGSGKTTLLSILGTMIPPDKGEVYIHDFSLQNEVNQIRNCIVPMFGWLRNIDIFLTVRQNVERNLRLNGIDPREVQEIIDFLTEKLELEERIDERLQRLSTGMAIKGTLISSLVQYLTYEMALVLCDEPFVGVDVASMKKIREIFIDYAPKKSAVILATHQARDLEVLCDRIGILDKGKILAIDSVDQLKKRIIQEERIKVELRPTKRMLEHDINLRERAPSFFERS